MKYRPRKGELVTGLDLRVTHLATSGSCGRKLYKIEQPVIFSHRDGKNYATPANFICDLASVPWKRRSPKYDIGAVPHDFVAKFAFLYVVDLSTKTAWRQPMTRREGDVLFSDINYTAGQKKFWVKLFFRAVRCWPFPWWNYRRKDYKYEKTDKEAAKLIFPEE